MLDLLFQCDLIYTFFHPIARDDKTEGLDAASKAPGEYLHLSSHLQLTEAVMLFFCEGYSETGFTENFNIVSVKYTQ